MYKPYKKKCKVCESKKSLQKIFEKFRQLKNSELKTVKSLKINPET